MDPSMALTSLPSSIGLDPNPQPSNRESSLLTTGPDFCPFKRILTMFLEANLDQVISKLLSHGGSLLRNNGVFVQANDVG